MPPVHLHEPGRPCVLNFHEVSADPATSVSIMRPNKYGNPFTVGGHRSRGVAILKYQQYVRDNFTREEVIADLEGKDLICCCKPKPCHGDWLLKWANPLM